jgi:hypothetical protein
MHYCTHCRQNVSDPEIEVLDGGDAESIHYFCPVCGKPTAREQANQKTHWIFLLALILCCVLDLEGIDKSWRIWGAVVIAVAWIIQRVVHASTEKMLIQKSQEGPSAQENQL